MMNKFARLVLILLALVLVLCTATACKVEVAIQSITAPTKIEYVKGQDLVLAGGQLTALVGEETVIVPLDSEEVVLSGYNKEVLGKQTITVAYAEQTTAFDVTVIQALQAGGTYKKDYFVGEELDIDKGVLVFTNDQGEKKNIPFSQDGVRFDGFVNTTDVDDLAITATYQGFTGVFNVNVHEVEEINLTSPDVLSYDSHEGAMDISGAYITLVGNGGKLEKVVEITEDMIDGVDFDLVTEEHSDTPLVQEVTVNYLGKAVGSFDIKIKYSDVDFIKAVATEFASLAWDVEAYEDITPEQNALAYEAFQLLDGLSVADTAYLTEEEIDNIVRVAFMYIYPTWLEDIAPVFEFVNLTNDDFALNSKLTYDQAKEAIVTIKAFDEEFYAMWDYVITMIEDHAETPIYVFEDDEDPEAEPSTMDINLYFGFLSQQGYFTIVRQDGFVQVLPALEFAVDLYEQMQAVPADWTIDTVDSEANATAITSAYNMLTGSSYANDKHKDILAIISMWRANNDLFDIMYQYYYKVEGNADVGSTVDILTYIILPSKLEGLTDAVYSLYGMYNNFTKNMLFETSTFMFYIDDAIAMGNKLYTEGNDLEKLLYSNFELSGYPIPLHLNLLKVKSYDLYGAMDGDPELEAFWQTYMTVLNMSTDDAQFGEQVEKLLAHYIGMTPTWQYGLMLSINPLYHPVPTGNPMMPTMPAMPQFAFLPSEQYLGITGIYYPSFFSMVINEYYAEVLPSTEDTEVNPEYVSPYYVFIATMLSAESYSHINLRNSGDATTFMAQMDNTIKLYGKLSVADKAVFDAKVGDIYNKYVAIRARYPEIDPDAPVDPNAPNPTPTKVDLGEWADEFQAMQEAILEVNNAVYLMQNEAPVYIAVVASYAKAQEIARNILDNAPPAIVYAYYDYSFTAEFDTGEADDPATPEDESKEVVAIWPYDFLMYRFQSSYNTIMSALNNTKTFYNTEELNSFLIDATYVLNTFLNYDEAIDNNFQDKDAVVAIMTAFRQLPLNDQLYVLTLDSLSEGMYTNGLRAFFQEVLPAKAENAEISAYDVAILLLNVERAYINYQLVLDGDAETVSAALTGFNTALADYTAGYNALTTEEKQAIDTYLGTMYQYYLDANTKANPSA